jgi:DNA-binding CsgD family transcriptional regulator
MSQKTDAAVMVMDLVSTALVAHDEGRSPQETICAGVAAMVGAQWAAYVQIDLFRGECHMVCRPFMVEPGLEVAQLNAADLPGFGSAQGSASVNQVGSSRTAEIPLSSAPGTLRLLAVSGRDPFTAHQLEVLRFAQPQLEVLDLHLQVLERLRSSARDSFLGSRDLGESGARYGITDRELEVLTLLSECMLARSIAAKMSISHRTVHKHLGSIYQKLKTHDRLTAVTRARGLGLLPPA